LGEEIYGLIKNFAYRLYDATNTLYDLETPILVREELCLTIIALEFLIELDVV